MSSQDYMAATTGSVDGIWWTEHDWRVVNFGKLESLDFSELRETHHPSPSVPDQPPDTITSEWQPVGAGESEPIGRAAISSERALEGETSLHLQVPGGDQRVGRWNLAVDNYRAVYPLFSRPTIELSVYPVSSSGPGAPFVEFLLSEQPPDLEQPRLEYVFGDTADIPASDDWRWLERAPVDADTWNTVTLDPAADVANLDLPVDGLDNALKEIRLGVIGDTSPTEAYFDAFEISAEHYGTELLDMQRELLEQLPTRVEHFPGVEISWDGQHVNALGSDVPVPDYWDRTSESFRKQEKVDHVHEYGGLACYNHPSTSDVGAHAEELIETDAYGVELIEIGRRNEDVSRRLELWDRISRHGIAVTGTGVGDIHSSSNGWERDPPASSWWVTHVWADELETEALTDGLRSGRAYFARPGAFSGAMDIRGDGVEMGEAMIEDGPVTLTATVEGATPGDTVRWVRNGDVLSETTLEEESSAVSIELAGSSDVRAVRWELLRSDDDEDEPTRIACSNPVYLLASHEQFTAAAAQPRLVDEPSGSE